MKKAFRTPLSDTSVNVNKSEKLNEAAQTAKNDEVVKCLENTSLESKKVKSKVPRSMSDAEYEEIFAAVLQRYVAADENTSSGGDTKDDEPKVKVKDDFDEVLHEEDPVTEKKVKEVESGSSGISSCKEEMKTEEGAEDSTSTIKGSLVPKGSPCAMKNSEICSPKPKAGELVKTQKKMTDLSEKKQKHALSSVSRTPQTASHKNKERPEVKTASLKVSRKEKMQKRVIEETGTWVQCCESSCLKWRYLADVTDPAKLPEFWTCFLNKDPDYDSCDKPEQEFNQAEHDQNYIFTKYTEGSVVWAKMIGFPWWPAMIEVDPDYDVFCECRDNTAQTVSHYHVVFFDEKVSRAWIRSDDISRFSSCESFDVMGPYKVGKSNYRSAVARAWEKAIIAATLPIKERLARYSFSVRFNGKWGLDGSDDSQGMEKLKSKRPHKRNYRRRAAGLEAEMNGDMSMTEEEMSQILDNAEAIIQNTEDVLDEFFTGSSQNNDSDFLPELESPVRKKPKLKTTKSKEEKKSLRSGRKQNTEIQKGKHIGKDVEKNKSQSKPEERKIPAFKAPRSSSKKDVSNTAVCKEFLNELDSDVYTMEVDGEILEHGDTPQLLAEDVTDYFKKELGSKELDDVVKKQSKEDTDGEIIEEGERKIAEGKNRGDPKENMTDDGRQKRNDSEDQEKVKDAERKEMSATEGITGAEGQDAKEDTVEDIEDTKEVNTEETTQKKVVTVEEGRKEKDKPGSQECFTGKSDAKVLDEKTVEDLVQSKNRAPRNKTKPPPKKSVNANNDKKRKTPKARKSKVSANKSDKENDVINTSHGPDIQKHDPELLENADNGEYKASKPVLSSQENKRVTKEMEVKRGAKKAKFAAPVAKNETKSADQGDEKGEGRSKNESSHKSLRQDDSRPDSETGPQTTRGGKSKTGIKRKASFMEEEEDDNLNIDVEVGIIQEESNKNASQKLEEKADSDFDFEE